MSDQANHSHRVLVVEDEFLLASLLEELLPELGCVVQCTAASVDDALDALSTQPIDIAFLDINLGGKPSFPVADALASRGIPFAFATGYGVMGLPEQYAGHIVLQKPYSLRDIEQALAKMTSQAD